MWSTRSVISENIHNKFHIYYSIRFLAYNFNEIDLYNGFFYSDIYNLARALFSIILQGD